MIEIIKELWYFQIQRKCPNCKIKLLPSHRINNLYHCIKCGWGEEC